MGGDQHLRVRSRLSIIARDSSPVRSSKATAASHTTGRDRTCRLLIVIVSGNSDSVKSGNGSLSVARRSKYRRVMSKQLIVVPEKTRPQSATC